MLPISPCEAATERRAERLAHVPQGPLANARNPVVATASAFASLIVVSPSAPNETFLFHSVQRRVQTGQPDSPFAVGAFRDGDRDLAAIQFVGLNRREDQQFSIR